uniref:Uncharacterized protein n=1 Tax=Rhizophagus irregularis (strain DAOM 181602 / DAOM 197198 / MUCL 43194) TaxID=747089 RepID=U9UI55_RHIID
MGKQSEIGYRIPKKSVPIWILESQYFKENGSDLDTRIPIFQSFENGSDLDTRIPIFRRKPEIGSEVGYRIPSNVLSELFDSVISVIPTLIG